MLDEFSAACCSNTLGIHIKTENQAECDSLRVSDHGMIRESFFSSVGWWNITTAQQNVTSGDGVGIAAKQSAVLCNFAVGGEGESYINSSKVKLKSHY